MRKSYELTPDGEFHELDQKASNCRDCDAFLNAEEGDVGVCNDCIYTELGAPSVVIQDFSNDAEWHAWLDQMLSPWKEEEDADC